jgi:hypothetical protein
MRHAFVIALIATIALVSTATAHAIQPLQTFVRPFDETFGYSNDEGTCQFETHFVGTQIFRLFYDREGGEVLFTEQGRTTLTLTNLLTGEAISGVNSFNLRTTPLDVESAEVGDVLTLRDAGAGLNALLFPADGPPIVLAGHFTFEVEIRVLVNDPESGEFFAEVISGGEDFTPHLRHLIDTAAELFCSSP